MTLDERRTYLQTLQVAWNGLRRLALGRRISHWLAWPGRAAAGLRQQVLALAAGDACLERRTRQVQASAAEAVARSSRLPTVNR